MQNNPSRTWILVANRAGAQILETHRRGAPISSIAKIDHPRGRLRAHEIESDRPGRTFDRVGGGKHAYSSEVSATDQVDRELVSELVQRMERGRMDHAFDQLAMIAPPKLLGELRAALPDPLRAMMVASLPQDLDPNDTRSIREHLRAVVLI